MRTKWSDVAFQGLVAGAIGYLTVAVVFAVANLALGRSPFHTAAVLGAALFYGITDPARVTVSAPYVFAFNGVHLFAFLVFGITGSALAQLADRGLQLWYVAVFFFIFVGFHLFAMAQALAMPVRDAVPDAAVWVAGIGASVLMGWYLLAMHPRAREPQPWSAERFST